MGVVKGGSENECGRGERLRCEGLWGVGRSRWDVKERRGNECWEGEKLGCERLRSAGQSRRDLRWKECEVAMTGRPWPELSRWGQALRLGVQQTTRVLDWVASPWRVMGERALVPVCARGGKRRSPEPV